MVQRKSPEDRKRRRDNPVIAILKFLPLFLFASLVLFFKFDLLLAAPISTFAAIVIYMYTGRIRFGDAFERGMEATKTIVLIFFILMFAYAVAECFMATGVGASMINLALLLGVTARTIAPVSLLSDSMKLRPEAISFIWLTRKIAGLGQKTNILEM